MVVRAKDAETSDTFQGYDPAHKKELYDPAHKKELCEFISNYDELFQEPRGFPPKREIQHEIHLQHDDPFPNIGMYRMSSIEMEEIKK